MAVTVYIALLVWPFVALGCFGLLGPRRGAMASLIGGFLFLPYAGFNTVDGVPGIEKNFIASFSTLLGVLIFDPERLPRYRFHWFDSFVVCGWLGWSISPVLNGLGLQQSLLDSWDFVFWAVVPYLLGRVYIDSPQAVGELAVALVVGTLAYAGFALIEMRMSPQFNRWIYGLPGAPFHTSRRMGGWRPRVFQYSGLGTAMWMAGGAVIAVALLFARNPRSITGVPVRIVAPFLVLTSLLSKGAGAMSLMVFGVASLVAARFGRSWLWTLIAPGFVVLYIVTGLIGPIVPVRAPLVDASAIVFDEVRAGSLAFRLRHEEALVWHALKSPVYGWGGWGRNLVEGVDSMEITGRGKTVPDGFWVIALGKFGMLGLVGTYGWMLFPAIFAIWRMSKLRVRSSVGFVVAGLALWSCLTAADLLLNGFIQIVQAFVAGGLASFAIAARRVRSEASMRRHRHGSIAPLPRASTPSRPRAVSAG